MTDLRERPLRQEVGLPRVRGASSAAEMLANRLRKNLRHLGKWARREGVTCYRVYDGDLPEYALAVDLYEGWAHVQEYAAPATVDAARAQARLTDAMFTIAGQTMQYVVTADATAVSGTITVSIYPALSASVSGSPVATFAYKAGGYRNNLAFHRNAIAAVIVPLGLPKGATQAEIINFEGIGVRVVYSYDSKYKKDVISFDFLMGAKVIQPELALRQVGAVAAKPSKTRNLPESEGGFRARMAESAFTRF